ncbi:uncharacterized protein LOC128233862 [Mya arenaria]|uniref:uncharacterized protein LOC128233862 n=1 Tax=Mya arenaria TaxID=6604 RepID=UPI0022E364A9|nr:uncharacterized protein LOC128233862 [Mya arenaria]
MLNINTICIFVSFVLLKHSNVHGMCVSQDDGKFSCTNGILPDPHGNKIITVKFTSNIKFTISNGSFESETWKQVERLELTKSPGVRVTVYLMSYAFAQLIQLKTLCLNIMTSVQKDSFVGLINLTILNLTDTLRMTASDLRDIFASNDSLPNLKTLVLDKAGDLSTVFSFNSALITTLSRRPIKSLYLQSIGVVYDIRALSGACGSLEYINMTDSRVSKYDRHRYQYDGICEKLKVIDISGMQIGSTTWFITNRLENLHLNLTNMRDVTPFRNVESIINDRFWKSFSEDTSINQNQINFFWPAILSNAQSVTI